MAAYVYKTVRGLRIAPEKLDMQRNEPYGLLDAALWSYLDEPAGTVCASRRSILSDLSLCS